MRRSPGAGPLVYVTVRRPPLGSGTASPTNLVAHQSWFLTLRFVFKSWPIHPVESCLRRWASPGRSCLPQAGMTRARTPKSSPVSGFRPAVRDCR